MRDPSATLLILLLSLSIGAIAYSAVVLWRLRRGAAAAPRVDRWAAHPAPAGGWPSVCVIVPAHNEAAVIARLVASLCSQDYPRLSVVFALDRCTDDTEAAVRDAAAGDPRVEILHIEHCPQDWAGKVHAAHLGWSRSSAAQAAEILIFTDADTWFDPRCVRAAVAAAADRGAGLLSLLSTLEAQRLWEFAFQPAAVVALMRQNPLDRVNGRGARRAFANGQFLLFRRDTYRAIGGHESVRDALLEDIAFALRCKNAMQPWAVLPAGPMLRCRMYDSPRTFREGWKRIYVESARRRISRLRTWAVEQLLTGVLLPLAGPAAILLGFASGGRLAGFTAAAGVLATSLWVYVFSQAWRAQGAPLWCLPLAPIGALNVARILFRGQRDLRLRRVVRWGGREYQLEPRARSAAKKHR